MNHIDVGPAFALGFNPISETLFFSDGVGVIYEINPDGSLSVAFNPGVGDIFGMAFTPTGDLALLDFAAVDHGIPLPSRLLLYDSSSDTDNVFTTSVTPGFGDCRGDIDGNGVVDGFDLAEFEPR